MNIGGTMPVTNDDINNAKIAIGFPSGANVDSQFMVHMTSMLMRENFTITTFANSSSSRIAFNRNVIVETAKQANSTHLLFVDADMTFPANGLSTLFSHGLDIIGATAAKRQEDAGEAIGLTLSGEPLCVPSEPVKMKFMGACFMLIKMSVFDKLKKPYFCEPPRWMMGEAESDGIMAEDEYFCHSAQKAGLDVWCDTQLSMLIGHRGPKTFYIVKQAQRLPLTPLYPFKKDA